MRNRLMIFRILVLLLLLLGPSCGGEPTLVVWITTRPESTTAIEVSYRLDGSEQEVFLVERNSPNFKIQIKEGTSAHLKLVISALDKDDCRAAIVELEETIGPALRVTKERTVSLSPLARAICPVTVQMPDRLTTVSSKNITGLSCSQSGDQCRADVPKGYEIQLISNKEYVFKTFAERRECPKDSLCNSTKEECINDGICSVAVTRKTNVAISVIRRSCSNDGFCVYPLPSKLSLVRRVWGRNPNNVWAIGEISGGGYLMPTGRLLNWNGFSWVMSPLTTMKNGSPLEHLKGIWESEDGNAWAVGQATTILQYGAKEKEWSIYSTSSEFKDWDILQGIWGSSERNVITINFKGELRTWNGSSWTLSSPTIRGTAGPQPRIHDIFGIDSDNIWAIGDRNAALILKKAGSEWIIEHEMGVGVSGMWGSDIHNVWAVGSEGTILKRNLSGIWDLQMSNTKEDLYAIWGSSKDNVWAVGKNGAIVALEKGVWTPKVSGTMAHLRSVWASNSGEVWAVGESTETGGIILRKMSR